MTVNKLIELITSKVMVIRGERYNATAFRSFDLDVFREELRRNGYAPNGKISVYNGQTGQPMEAMIFEGPCYYQALTHNVLDKFQMRAEGPILAASHQPRGGRSSGSGLQFGKHEVTALIGHGAVHNLQERLMLLSDPAYAIVCKQCGRDIRSNPDANTMVCVSCTQTPVAASGGSDALARRVLIPYSVRRIITTLGGLGMQLRMKPHG